MYESAAGNAAEGAPAAATTPVRRESLFDRLSIRGAHIPPAQ